MFRDYPEVLEEASPSLGGSGSEDFGVSGNDRLEGGAEERKASIPRGVWVVEIGGSRKLTLLGLRADRSKRLGLVFDTRENGEVDVSCDGKETFRMWLGVAATLFPVVSGDSGRAGGE